VRSLVFAASAPEDAAPNTAPCEARF
jgi:hypothetical protein